MRVKILVTPLTLPPWFRVEDLIAAAHLPRHSRFIRITHPWNQVGEAFWFEHRSFSDSKDFEVIQHQMVTLEDIQTAHEEAVRRQK